MTNLKPNTLDSFISTDKQISFIIQFLVWSTEQLFRFMGEKFKFTQQGDA